MYVCLARLLLCLLELVHKLRLSKNLKIQQNLGSTVPDRDPTGGSNVKRSFTLLLLSPQFFACGVIQSVTT